LGQEKLQRVSWRILCHILPLLKELGSFLSQQLNLIPFDLQHAAFLKANDGDAGFTSTNSMSRWARVSPPWLGNVASV
jgi:hypothetical protein